MKVDEVTVNGVRVNGAEAQAASARVITLPSGDTATIRKPTGRHLIRAHRAAPADDPIALFYALLAEVVEIGGKRVVYEELLEMELPDVFALLREVFGENFTEAAGVVASGSLPPQPSPGSSTSDSQSRN